MNLGEKREVMLSMYLTMLSRALHSVNRRWAEMSKCMVRALEKATRCGSIVIDLQKARKSTAASHRSFRLTFRREERKSEETQQRISHCFIPWRTTKAIAKKVPARRRGCAGRAGHTAKHQISGRRRALPRATTSIPSPAFSGTDGYIMRRGTAYNLRYSQKATSVGSSALFSPFLFFFLSSVLG